MVHTTDYYLNNGKIISQNWVIDPDPQDVIDLKTKIQENSGVKVSIVDTFSTHGSQAKRYEWDGEKWVKKIRSFTVSCQCGWQEEVKNSDALDLYCVCGDCAREFYYYVSE